MGKGKTNSGGGSNLSKIVVTCETGSTVYIMDENDNRRDTTESNGTWTFHNVPIAKWTAYATKNDKWTSEEVDIKADAQQFVYNVELSYFNATIDVTYPEGSTCTCTLGERVLTAEDTTGRYVFKVKASGEWTVKCVDGDDSAEQKVNITTNDVTETITLSYQLYASDFVFYLDENKTTPATLGTDYQIVYDDDTEIPQSEWTTAKNWKIRNLVTIYCVPLKDGEIDVFAVGAGGGGGNYTAGGGGGGYTTTARGIKLIANTIYKIEIGAGGNGSTSGSTNAKGGTGGTTSAFGVEANGGQGGGSNWGSESDRFGGDGGSGGGTGGDSARKGGDGGSDGGDGEATSRPTNGKGQGTTTREFGETNGKLYAGGGAGGAIQNGTGGDGGGGDGGKAGAANTGGGGGGGRNGDYGGAAGKAGGSGIVVFRNARETEVAA